MRQNSNQPLITREKSRGCGTIVLFAFLSLWVIIVSGIDIFINWALEQSLFENSTAIPDFRWVNHGICALLLLVSLLISYFLVKNPRIKLSLRVWMMAAGFAVLTTPVKKLWITYQQETTVMLILVMFVYIVGLFLFRKRNENIEEGDKKKKNSSILGIAALISGGIILPWVMWGSLGSINDTLLYLMLGALFGYMVVQILYPFLFEKTQLDGRELRPVDFLLDGFVVAIFFIILLTGLSQNGSQPLLLITLPISGWVLTLIAMATRGTLDKGKASVGLIAGIALVAPLVWFDMDELAVVLSSTPGEALEWATKAAWFTFSVSMLIMIVMAINFKLINRIRLPKRINWILPLLVFAALSTVYFTIGRPGFFGEKIFVVMKEQASLSDISPTMDVADRREKVYSELVDQANTSQADLRTQLDQWHLSYTPYYLVDGLEVNAGVYFKMLIAKRSDVERILESPHLRPLPQKAALTNSDPVSKPIEPSWNLTMIGVDKVWKDLNVTGKGIVVGQTDTGVDGRHSELESSYRGVDGSDDYNWLDPWNDSPFPVDVQGHGTATLGIITGKEIGIAPDAKWIGCVNLARNLGNPAEYLNCLQFMLAPYPQGRNAFSDGIPSKGAMIVNNSWGCPLVEGCDSQTFESAVNALETAGIFMSVAAGNNGYYGCNTVSDPLAIYENVFTVGAINEAGELSAFSSLGPVSVDGSGRIKPNILAPGEQIISAFPNDAYIRADGTSLAAPHVTGVVALMWSANPVLIGNIELTRQILEDTAKPYTGTMPECVVDNGIPNNAAGYGVLDAYAAVQAAQAVK